jgi:hypothetical protein
MLSLVVRAAFFTVRLSVVMLDAVMLSVVMLKAVVLSVAAPRRVH